ncbi:MAG: Acetolactate synthase isozyme 3 large subunit [Promethearchaeota archaeon]|nr:MAG: Acetolactate synthase isozyme 3 large subunit [Candidatus Lokiarchaeota archaeon]
MYTKEKTTGGDLLVECLLNEGVTTIFGIVGGELLRIYDAIERWGREEGIDTVMMRHEQAGGHAADAWARGTGEIGVCLGTAGPGVTHLVPAVAAAWADSIPMLVIGAQIARMFDNTGILQGNLDQMKLMEPITKAQISVEAPYEIPKAFQRAMKIAMTGRKGPVFLELRETALVRKAKEAYFREIVPPEKYRPIYRPSGNQNSIKEAVDLLKTVEKPIIIAGGGTIASDASSNLIKLSQQYRIPAGTTINGIGAISCDQDTYIGSYLTNNAFRTAASQADLILSFGAKWDYTLLYGAAPIWNQNQKIIQNDIDPEIIGRNRPVDVPLVGDAKVVIDQLLLEMEESLSKAKIAKWNEWNQYLTELKQEDQKLIQKILKSDKLPIKPQRLAYEVLDFIKPDTQFVLDGGDIAVFTFGLLSNKTRLPNSTYYPISMGHLGTGIPHAIGAQIAKPDKEVVCLTGDGSFMFNIQELDTATRLNLPIIIVVANNSCWGMIKSNQKNNLNKRYCDVDFPQTNYADIAKGFGCYVERVTEPSEIKSALQRAKNSGKTSVIDVEIAFETPPAMKIVGLWKKSKGLFENP